MRTKFFFFTKTALPQIFFRTQKTWTRVDECPPGMIQGKRERNGPAFVRATLRKSCPPTSCSAAERFAAIKLVLSGAVPLVSITRVPMTGIDAYKLGNDCVEGTEAVCQKYKDLLRVALEEFLPASVIHELIENKKIGELEATDVVDCTTLR